MLPARYGETPISGQSASRLSGSKVDRKRISTFPVRMRWTLSIAILCVLGASVLRKYGFV